MSLRGPRCAKHPSHLLVGVCAFCLRERLAGLAELDCGPADARSYSNRRKKQSPRRPLAASLDPHKQHPCDRRGGERQPSGISFESRAKEGLQHDPISRLSAAHGHGTTDRCLEKSEVAESSAHATIDKLNKSSVGRVLLKPSATCAPDAITVQFSKPNDTSAIGSVHPTIVSDQCCDDNASTEILPGRQSFAAVSKGPSDAPLDCNKLPPPDIKMPILENNQCMGTETKNNMPLQKNTSVGCTSPRARMGEHLVRMGGRLKPVPPMNEVDHAASMDRERNSFHVVLGARRSLPFPEPMNAHVKDEEIVLMDTSTNPKHRKKTLSSLFSLDDAECPSSKGKAEEPQSGSNVRGDALSNSSASAPTQNIVHSKAIQRRCRHGSFSERVEQSAYLFPVPETANSKPLSWFAALFRRRKKKSRPKAVETLASYSEHNNGWDDARQSWDAPRPSSWEQFRFSSFEGPRSSWEPARPSWEGVMRTSDAESVFSGFDFLTESLHETREDAIPAHKSQQELAGGDCMNGFSEARKSVDGKRLGLKSKPSVIKTPHSDDKDRPPTFVSAKATLMQRDVSTQTTPPRSSDVTEVFIQQRLQHSHRREQQHTKASHAVWSKVWTKTFSNSKWAFKQKHHKERRPKEMGDATAISVDEVLDQGNMTSGRSSFQERTNIASHQHSELINHDIKEHEAWDTFYSPLQHGGDVMSRFASKGVACIPKDEHIDKARVSNCALDSGLLKFYLTPVRGHGKSKQGIYGV